MFFAQDYVKTNYLKQNKKQSSMNTLKSKIKTLSTEQTDLKFQRKTVYGPNGQERKISASEAAHRHLLNRGDLRRLQIAYAILREKDPTVAVNSFNPEDTYSYEFKAVANLVKFYADQFTRNKTEETAL